jgi:hypothetical protein
VTDSATEEVFWGPRRWWRRPVVIAAAAVLVVALVVTAVLVVRHVLPPANGASRDPSVAAEHWLHDLGAGDADAACVMTWFGKSNPPLRKGSRDFDRCVAKVKAYLRGRSDASLATLRRVKVLDTVVSGEFVVVLDGDLRPPLEPDDFPVSPRRIPVVLVRYHGLWYATYL